MTRGRTLFPSVTDSFSLARCADIGSSGTVKVCMRTLRSQASALAFFLSLCFQLTTRAQTNPLPSVPDTTTASDSVITFNEIMYHPAREEIGMEWLELYNQMSVNMDISNWRIEGGVTFQFPSNTVFAANSYLVVAADPERLRGRTGLTNGFGPFM